MFLNNSHKLSGNLKTKIISFTVLLFIRDRKLTQTGLEEFVGSVTKSVRII